MAAGADLAIDLVAALEGGAVEGAENALEAPLPLRGMLAASGGRGGAGQQDDSESGGECGAKQPLAHHALSIAPAPPGTEGGEPPSTGSPMLSGRGRGRSKTESSGRMTRKCTK